MTPDEHHLATGEGQLERYSLSGTLEEYDMTPWCAQALLAELKRLRADVSYFAAEAEKLRQELRGARKIIQERGKILSRLRRIETAARDFDAGTAGEVFPSEEGLGRYADLREKLHAALYPKEAKK